MTTQVEVLYDIVPRTVYDVIETTSVAGSNETPVSKVLSTSDSIDSSLAIIGGIQKAIPDAEKVTGMEIKSTVTEYVINARKELVARVFKEYSIDQ